MSLPYEDHVDRIVARGIYRVAISAVVSILVISLTNSLLQGEILRVFSDNASDANPVQFADESISVLGNIASAGVGALAGWWSRGMMDRPRHRKEGDDGS